jgi:signal transduction histidine kinase
VQAILDEVVAMMEPQFAARGLACECPPGDPAVTAWADPEKVRQILLNLFSNAVKFTPPGGSVVTEWETEPERVRVRVRDTGAGIPADKLQAIFDPFVQVNPGLTRETGGTGLGLSISRDLARAMGGDLTVESAPGEGSTFTLVLPRTPPAAE